MKDTLKILSLLEENIERVAENGIYEIERDLLLERLRGLYASVIATEAVAEEDRVLDALMGIGAALPEDELEPEIEIERIYAEETEDDFETEEEVIEEEISEPEVDEIEEVPEPAEEEKTLIEEVADKWLANILQTDEQESEEEAVVEEPIVEEEPIAEAVENDELDHEAVMSLYDDDDEEEEELAAEPTEEETEEEVIPEESEVEEEPEVEEDTEEEVVVVLDDEDEEPEIEEEPEAESQKVVLGDILLSEQSTVADNLVEQGVVDVATAASAVLTLRETIGVNDKYILMRDLFASNNDYYEQAIEKLDSFDSLDEAMLYIYDNFHWNPNCEGARLLMELLARKLF